MHDKKAGNGTALAVLSVIVGLVLGGAWNGFAVNIEAVFAFNPALFLLLTSIINAFALLLVFVLPAVIIHYRKRISDQSTQIERLNIEIETLKNQLKLSEEVKLRMDAASYISQNKR